MTVVKTRIRIASDGTLSGHAAGLPVGEHEAEITVSDVTAQPAALDSDDLLANVRTIQAEIARLRVLDRRSANEIIGYNERGHLN